MEDIKVMESAMSTRLTARKQELLQQTKTLKEIAVMSRLNSRGSGSTAKGTSMAAYLEKRGGRISQLP